MNEKLVSLEESLTSEERIIALNIFISIKERIEKLKVQILEEDLRGELDYSYLTKELLLLEYLIESNI